ncbi:MAG TPA: hypothetical protein VEA41_08525 [Salinarimonas sp.]|jgi:hypothetical protein|nr:hypothetical protein [Salinarimonas sp.]
MPVPSRLLALAVLSLPLAACQTYEATYVETPRARRTVVVERGYDPYAGPATVYTERRVYREPAYDPYVYRGPPRSDPYRDTYRERRYDRYGPPPVVSRPVYPGGPPPRVIGRSPQGVGEAPYGVTPQGGPPTRDNQGEIGR